MAWDTFRECCDCLKLVTLMVDAAEPSQARMLSLAERNFSTATDLADTMVRDSGLSFRDAHHVVGGVVRMAMDQGLAANQITSAMVDQAAREVIGRPLGMPAATVASCLDPTQAVAARRTVGSPSPNEVRRGAGVVGNVLAAARGRPGAPTQPAGGGGAASADGDARAGVTDGCSKPSPDRATPSLRS